MGQNYTTRDSCRVCGGKRLIPLFSLGAQYVSDFIDPTDNLERQKVPIDISLCNRCSLVQNIHTAPQEILYARHYWYRSGVTQTMREALSNIVQSALKCVWPSPGDVVLDIGSNDGSLLRSYPTNLNLHTVGVEPATNLQALGSDRIKTFIPDFWSWEAYCKVMDRKPVIITAIGMFYDLEDPNKFIRDIASVLHSNGVFIAQLMCLKNMISVNDLGNFAHEHLEFYSIESLEFLFDKYGLEIYDIETNEVNGESYRLYIRHIGSNVKARDPMGAAYRMRAARLADKPCRDFRFYDKMYKRMAENKERVVNYVKAQVSAGKEVWVYGASTKGNVLLQYYGLDHTLITGAAERSPEKWGKVTVGTRIPIYSEREARERNPSHFLVLPYAFIDEFVRREHDWINKGGKFIVPLPEMRIIP